MLINRRKNLLQEIPDPLSMSLQEFADYIISTDVDTLLKEFNDSERDDNEGLALTAEAIKQMKETYAHDKEEYWRF